MSEVELCDKVWLAVIAHELSVYDVWNVTGELMQRAAITWDIRHKQWLDAVEKWTTREQATVIFRSAIKAIKSIAAAAEKRETQPHPDPGKVPA